ncbi:MAG: hypothetical protein ACQESR_30365 [Planctomycetota bacterium]
MVRSGKGDPDRITVLPERARQPLREQIERVRRQHQRDLAEGFGAVYLPFALERKCPNENREFGWQWGGRRNEWPRWTSCGQGEGCIDADFLSESLSVGALSGRGRFADGLLTVCWKLVVLIRQRVWSPSEDLALQ